MGSPQIISTIQTKEEIAKAAAECESFGKGIEMVAKIMNEDAKQAIEYEDVITISKFSEEQCQMLANEIKQNCNSTQPWEELKTRLGSLVLINLLIAMMSVRTRPTCATCFTAMC